MTRGRRAKRTVPRQRLRTFEVKRTLRGIPGPVVLATDASVGATHIVSGFLCSNGRTGFRAHPYPPHITGRDRTTIAELRAVYWGLRAAKPGSAPVTVLTDSLAALRYLRDWKSGSRRMPPSYSTAWRRNAEHEGTPTLELLADLVAERSGYAYRHVKGHAGHPLNEGAHYMAYLGSRCIRGTLSKERAVELIGPTMETSLLGYAEQ